MAVPLGGEKLGLDEKDLQLFFPVLTTSPAFPQAGDSYLSEIELKNIDIKSLYLEKGNMDENINWDGNKYDWTDGVTEIQTDFINSGDGLRGNFNLLENTSLATLQMANWHKVYEEDFYEKSKVKPNLINDSNNFKTGASLGSVIKYQENVEVLQWGAKDATRITTTGGTYTTKYSKYVLDNKQIDDKKEYAISIYLTNNSSTESIEVSNNMGNRVAVLPKQSRRVIINGGKKNGSALNLQINILAMKVSSPIDVTVWRTKAVEGNMDDWGPSQSEIDAYYSQTYNWHYSPTAPTDRSKIWVNTSMSDFSPLFWAGTKWENYYEMMQKKLGGEIKIIEQKTGNSFQISKNDNGYIGIAQFARLKENVIRGEYVTGSFEMEEKSNSGGAVMRMEFYDINKKLIEVKFSPRFFNKSEAKKRFSHPFMFTDRTNVASYIRLSVLGVEDRFVNLATNKIKAEKGFEDTGWNLSEEEVTLDLNAGQIQMPMLNGIVDKSKVISEIAVLRAVLGEGLLKWEEVTRIKASSMREAVLYDYFIENGNYYKYALQPILANGVKGAITSFYDVVTTMDGFWLLGENDMQFSFIYDGKIGEIDYVKPVDMVETIGSQFPYFVRSSELEYKTFPFSGKLTYHQDVQKLLTSETYSAAISPDPTVPISYVELKYGDEKLLNMKNDLEEMQDGMVMQRVWRDKILKWLNDGKPKILKSEAQGNILVMVSKVRVTPIESVFGLVSDFECTMTQIGTLNEKTVQKYKLRKPELSKDDLLKEAMSNSQL